MAGKEIRTLCNELRRLGYYEFQIKDLITPLAGNKKIDDLPLEIQERIKLRLSEQVSFARKCIQVRFKSPL